MSNRTMYLDGLRGLLAIVVFNEHFLKVFYPLSSLWEIDHTSTASLADDLLVFSFLQLFIDGSFAVSGFFVLSGYLLTKASFESVYFSKFDLFERCVKRYLRLAVPVTVALIGVWCLHLLRMFSFEEFLSLNMSAIGPLYLPGNEPELIKLLAQGTLYSIFFVNPNFNPVIWTIAPEMWFGVIIFSLIFILRHIDAAPKVQVLLGLSSMGLLIALGKDFAFIGIPLGAFLYFTLKLTRDLQLNMGAIKVLLILICLGFLLYDVKGGSTHPLGILDTEFHRSMSTYVTSGLFWFFLLFLTIITPTIQLALNSPFLVLVGRYSFGFYLSHYLVLCSIGMSLHISIQNTWFTSSLIVGLFSFVTSLIIGAGMYRYVERPVLKLQFKRSFNSIKFDRPI